MKKGIFIANIIKASIVLAILVFALSSNEQLAIRLMIITFILLIICYMAKNLCGLLDKPSGAKVFQNLYTIIFMLFFVGFLITWSCSCIKSKQYFPLLFTIPFWFGGFLFFRKTLLKNKPEVKHTNKTSNFDFKIVISSILVFSVLSVGNFCLASGIKGSYQMGKKIRNYLPATGYYQDYEIYDLNNETGQTYRLIYAYEVNGQEYTIKTDYGSGSIPSQNSTREIKYNPDNPSEAVFTGTNRNIVLISFGTFFLLGGSVFVLIFLSSKGVFAKVKIDIIGLYVGAVFLILGIGIIAFQMGEVASLKEVLKNMGLWIIIPIMFIIIGIIQIIKCFFHKHLEPQSSIATKI